VIVQCAKKEEKKKKKKNNKQIYKFEDKTSKVMGNQQ
jgi:hypothetical protein